MNQTVILLILAVLVCSCSSTQTPDAQITRQATLTDTPTAQPTNTSTPKPTSANTPTSTPSPTSTPTHTPTNIPTLTPTPDPYDYRNIGFPFNPEDVIALVENYGGWCSYGDNTHDGVDIRVRRDIEVPVLAVDDGKIIHREWVNDSVGYEIYFLLGYDANGKRVVANYVHMDEALPKGTTVNRGDVIGYITQAHGGGPTGDHILFFGIRIGTQVRRETPSDGAPGDEVDPTPMLLPYLRPDQIVPDNTP